MTKIQASLLWIALIIAATIALSACSARVTSSSPSAGTAQAKSQFSFLIFSDVHLDTGLSYSNYNKDAGTDLWDMCRDSICAAFTAPNAPSFMLYTGDLPKHDLNATERGNIFRILLDSMKSMASSKKVPLFYLPGNNDALGDDYCSFLDGNKNAFSDIRNYPYPYEAFNVSKTPVQTGAYMVNDSNIAEGYYSAQVMKGLRIICLNSVLWSNMICTYCSPECLARENAGNKEMAWMERQLYEATLAGDKVYLAMHIPPGLDAYKTKAQNPVYMWDSSLEWQNNFLRKIALYKTTITGIFYGHTHMDEFRLIYANDSINADFMQVALSCPGISPKSGNNPGFKLVTADAAGKFPTDFTTYYTTVDPLKWQGSYQFSQYKKKYNITAYTIHDALKQMTPAQRAAVLNSIYTVQHKTTPTYATSGMIVKPAGTDSRR